jgi:hypothetical protein
MKITVVTSYVKPWGFVEPVKNWLINYFYWIWMSVTDSSPSRNDISVYGKKVTTWVSFVIVGVLFIFASTLETVLVKDSNFEYNLIWPCYTAFLLSCGWPLQVLPLLFRSKLTENTKVIFIKSDHKKILHSYEILLISP